MDLCNEGKDLANNVTWFKINHPSSSLCSSILRASFNSEGNINLQACEVRVEVLDPNVQARVNNGCIVFVQSPLGLVMKGCSGLSL